MKQIKYSIQELLAVGFTLIVLGVGISYGLDVTSDIRDGFTANTLEYNATTDAMTGVSKISAKIPTIATVVVASVVIGILVVYLWQRFAK